MDSEKLVEAVSAELKKRIYCDATGLSPAVASVFLTGFDEAARAAMRIVVEECAKSVESLNANLEELAKKGDAPKEFYACAHLALDKALMCVRSLSPDAKEHG